MSHRALQIGRDATDHQGRLKSIFIQDYESRQYCLELQAFRGLKVEIDKVVAV